MDKPQDRPAEEGARAPYLGPAVRRPMVLDAACALFAEAGFEAASMSAIAKRARITKPVLYTCFPGGKQEIILTLLDREEERVLDHLQGVLAMTRRMPVGEGIRLGVRAFLDYSEINPDGFRLLIASPSTTDPEVQRRTERLTERIVELMGERAAELAQAMGAPPVVGQTFTRAIVAMSYALAKWWARDKPMDRDALAEMAAGFVMKGLEGLVPGETLNRGLRSTN